MIDGNPGPGMVRIRGESVIPTRVFEELFLPRRCPACGGCMDWPNEVRLDTYHRAVVGPNFYELSCLACGRRLLIEKQGFEGGNDES